LRYKNISDCHSHSNCSFDGTRNMRDMCMNAIEMGLVYYAVTDHCECNQYMNVPHIPGGRYYDVVRQSYAELLQNQERFPNLKLLRGIELGQPLQDLNAAHDALTGRDYDVVIGSLHNIRDHDDFYHIGEHNPTEQEIDNALHAYFAESLEMVEWGKFDTLAHITYPLRYMCKAGETPKAVSGRAGRGFKGAHQVGHRAGVQHLPYFAHGCAEAARPRSLFAL